MPQAATINPARVEEILAQAVADSGAPIEGVMHTFELNRSTVAEHRDEIVGMLDQLSDEFMDNGGGGWSFLNLCADKHGRQWTGMHSTCEALIVLALALDLASFLMPRELWDALPGGVPYVVFKRSAFASTQEAA